MFSSILRSLPRLGRRWTPLDFSNPNFVRIPEYHKIEEETLPDYTASWYYPTQIGEVIQERYQVVGKLGFGSTSTAWLARDMNHCQYVMLKIFVRASSMGNQVDDEIEMYRHIEQCPKGHPGRDAVRTLLDTFYINGPEDRHRCLVHRPLWESVLTFLRRNPVERLPAVIVAVVLRRLFLALDYLHTECQVIHTGLRTPSSTLSSIDYLYLDIKADNIMLGIDDDSVFGDFEQSELQHPVPRKEVDPNGRILYMSQELKMPKPLGAPVLCDFGSAVFGNQSHTEFVQPDIYRAPEVILGAPWTYSVDIWNVGCMIWDIYQGGSLFSGYDPEYQKYRSRAHLAEIITLLGPPPSSLLTQGGLSDKFFSDDGNFRTNSLLKDPVSLEQRENTLVGEPEREAFLRLMRKMLQWEPGKRSSAKELAEDEWIQQYL
ncbi:protein kinase [Aspergillus campestris IBT 28561]|uniref:Protein kinase n=1 Tax=Aspergillus campestris (strain IBT 28561) TaxID=1392248 RepID=A0A2I1DBF7_ASPC2|nr:protein kinase [Aspergillus campestris IBT 28561]PKY07214.1 protein kinase [Aspergillus campestris IBT 28561]